ncbi:MAG: DarT ssDNA thymidine ADP-ribosyltransferase family protein [Kiritimatiellia bacterium]
MSDLGTDAQAIAAFAQERGITRLVHFTPLMNLCGIYNLHGLKPRRQIIEYAQAHEDKSILDYIKWNDSDRHDGRLDCINLSIQRINTSLFHAFKRKIPNAATWTWCILEIDPVCLQHANVLFTIANAAATEVRRHGTGGGIEGLKKLFAPEVFDGKCSITRTGATPKNTPTSPQAEVLYPGEIGLDLIRGLVFESTDHARQAYGMLSLECPGIQLPPLKIVPGDFN